MTHGSVFSGIGAPELAAEWMGWKNVFHCEKDIFCQKILSYHFPESEPNKRIKETCFTKYANRIDVFTGGFPCQPWSTTGEQLGESDPRHLFPEMFRAIREIKPRWVVAENVYGLTTKKFSSTLENICSSMEAEGYEIQPIIIPASSVKAPHERYRLFIIAHSCSLPGSNPGLKEDRSTEGESKTIRKEWKWVRNEFIGDAKEGSLTNSKTQRLAVRNAESFQIKAHPTTKRHNRFSQWRNFPTQSPVRSGNDGLSFGLDGITFSKWCKETIKAAGNSIVPHIMYEIFYSIEQYEKLSK